VKEIKGYEIIKLFGSILSIYRIYNVIRRNYNYNIITIIDKGGETYGRQKEKS
jgi:hypothetical protein